jgi:Cys-rich repeat protein
VILAPDQSKTLAPGAYGNLTINSRSTVSLKSGTYYFTSFSTEPQAKINLDETAGPVIIYVTGSLTAKGDWVPSGGTGTNLLIAVLGTGIADFQTAIVGTVVAPNGTVNLERPSNNASHKGAVFAKNIEVFSDTKLLFASVNWNFLCPAGDTDGDGVSDCQDLCKFDPKKSDPGVCGCGVADTDTDGDGVPDCKDACPSDAKKTRVGVCGGCGKPAAPAGTACTDGICAGHLTCDGAGTCGNPAACSPDPGNCVAREAGNSIYWVCQGSVTWSQALARCAGTPGQSLVEIDSRAENALVSQWVTGPAWTGANDQTALGTWRWSKAGNTDGNIFYASGNVLTGSFARWALGAPGDNAGRCATLQSGGTWSDQACTQTLSTYICEIPGPLVRLDGPTPPSIGCGKYSPNKTCPSASVPDAGPCVPADAGLPGSFDAVQNQLEACNNAGCTQDGDPGCSQCTGVASVPPPGTNNCTPFGNQQCAIQPVQPPVSCTSNSDCATGQVCDLAVTCNICDERDGANNCVKACPPATLLCGTRVAGCAQATDDNGITRCGQAEICPDTTANGDNNYLTDPGSDLSSSTFDPGVFGQPATPVGTYPPDPACSTAPNCAPQGMNHPWCTYVVDDTLNPKNPEADSKHGHGGKGSLVQFDFDPNLNLTFDVTPKALAEMEYDLEAVASLATSVTFNLPVLGSTTVPILDAKAALMAHRCRIWTTDSHFALFGQEFLPSIAGGMLFSAGSDDPTDPVNGGCAKALGDFQTAVSRAKKALKDAEELLNQYKANGNSLQAHLCPQIASDPPFGFPPGDCANESPEATINRFIQFYEAQVASALTSQTNLGGLHPAVPQTAISFGAPPPSNPQDSSNTETMPIINAEFFLGPIPMNLEVEAALYYGILGDINFEFNPSSLLGTGERERLARVGGEVTPWAAADVSLFVGAGFSIDGLSAKAGVQGDVNLGNVSAPVTAGAGVEVQATDDVRPLPSDLASVAISPPLVAPKQYHFYMDYDYGIQVVLSDVLSGSLSAMVRVKIAFFHKSWSKRLVTFGSPIPTQTLNLVSDGSGNTAGGLGDWGVVQMPTPFVKLQQLTVPATSTGTTAFNPNQVEKLFYDRLCVCQPLGQGCNSAGDCCPSTTGGPAPVCFGLGSAPKVCSMCRAVNQTCNTTADCCQGQSQPLGCNNATHICQPPPPN